uniref:Uncharacterized protein n=1 Tax=Hericium coralloides TaxID=100756 RepID=A0A1P8NNI4_HERCO|nr:hypothetical protein [Hericium coralloides]APX41092.1 hypothetical protein [Hericium coralloides]
MKIWLILFFKNIYNKIPNWIKIILKILLFYIFIIRIFGIQTIFDIFFNYTKLFCIISCLFVILYELFFIGMLLLFSSGKIQISDLLPIFIQNRLNIYKELSSNRVIVKDTLEYIYIHIGIYSFILVLILIVF